MRALVAEDDLQVARGISLLLKTTDTTVDHVDTGEEALALSRHYEYDIVLLDLILPDIDGFEVLRRMRIARNETPVLILSGLTRPQDKVKGLGLGADDFISKPFDKPELLARIQAVVRRSRGFSQPILQIGPLQLNLNNREASVDGNRVPLTDREYSILELLGLRQGTMVTKGALMNYLYDGLDEPDIKVIDVFIHKLRRKLMKAGAEDMIATVWGHGYLMREPSVRPISQAEVYGDSDLIVQPG